MIADWVLPLVVIGALRVALRYAVVGAMPWSNPFYAPQLSLAEAGRKGLTFLSALTNASFGWHDKTGAPGVGTLVAHLLPGGVADGANTVDAVVGTVVLLVLAASVVLGRRARRGFVVPAVWMAAFFAPPILVRNVQVYYAYEPLAGAAVLLAVAWSATSARCRRVVAATIAVVAAGGVASNHFALYDWQFAADSARMIVPVIADHRGTEVRSVSIVTADVPFWRWTLTADLKAPMIEFLLGRPGTPVRFYDRAALAAAIPPLDRAHLVLDADAGFAPAVVPRR
jgi:hypothetical protein